MGTILTQDECTTAGRLFDALQRQLKEQFGPRRGQHVYVFSVAATVSSLLRRVSNEAEFVHLLNLLLEGNGLGYRLVPIA